MKKFALVFVCLLVALASLVPRIHGASLLAPRAGDTLYGSFQIVMDTNSVIASVQLDRAWPYIGGFYPFRFISSGPRTNIWTIDEDDLTSGEYQVWVWLEGGEFITSYLFIVLTPTPMMKIWYPDWRSAANVGDEFILMWDYYGYRFTPTMDFARVQITAPKDAGDKEACEDAILASMRVFGPGRVKLTITDNCPAGDYLIEVVQADNPNNRDSVVLRVDSGPTIRPELFMRPAFESFYVVRIGKGTEGPWAMQYSFNNQQWYELPGLYKANSEVVLVSSGPSLFVRLRRR